MKKIIVLGGSYAGISTAHRILKQVDKIGSFKITLVSPNSDMYWNMASPRGIIPGLIPDDQMFSPIAAGFSHYSPDQFKFELASATAVDVEAQEVTITDANGERTLDYDYLIIATGSRTKTDTPFKPLDSTAETKKLLHTYQASVKKAQTIVVAGGGVTGVEIAGELGAQYGREKDIILITSHPTLLTTTPASVSTYATSALLALNVTIRPSTTITNSNGNTLHLSDGSTLTPDMYIPAFGLVPNSSFLPAQYLDAQGFISVDTHLRLAQHANVWALGDVCATEGMQFLTCDRQSVYVAKCVGAEVSGKKLKVGYKPLGSRMMGLQIGPNAGIGHFGSWKLPSFLVVRMRKTLFVEKMGPMVSGKGV